MKNTIDVDTKHGRLDWRFDLIEPVERIEGGWKVIVHVPGDKWEGDISEESYEVLQGLKLKDRLS